MADCQGSLPVSGHRLTAEDLHDLENGIGREDDEGPCERVTLPLLFLHAITHEATEAGGSRTRAHLRPVPSLGLLLVSDQSWCRTVARGSQSLPEGHVQPRSIYRKASPEHVGFPLQVQALAGPFPRQVSTSAHAMQIPHGRGMRRGYIQGTSYLGASMRL